VEVGTPERPVLPLMMLLEVECWMIDESGVFVFVAFYVLGCGGSEDYSHEGKHSFPKYVPKAGEEKWDADF
jgi:hypothetical protein